MIFRLKVHIACFLVIALLFSNASDLCAQEETISDIGLQEEKIEGQVEDEVPNPKSQEAIEKLYKRISKKNPSIDPNRFLSLLFTAGQHSLILEAREGFLTRPPTGSETASATETAPVVMGPREISLGGIVYISKADWTVWINGQKISPTNLPPEILDINVSKHFIKIKWYDAYTNQVFPIKMRSHQRFNLDTRIFLPG